MEIAFQLAIALASFLGATALGYFFYVAMRDPENMSLGLSGPIPKTASAWVNLGLVSISWMIFSFSGAYGLLWWWLPDQVIAISFIFSITSLQIIAYVEKSAHVYHSYQIKLIILDELKEIIGHNYAPSEFSINAYREKSESAGDAARRAAFTDVAHLALILSQRDRKLCEINIAESQEREKNQSIELEKKLKLDKDNIDKLNRLKKLNAIISNIMPNIAVIEKFSDIDQVEKLLLEERKLSHIWKYFNQMGSKLRASGDIESIKEMLGNMPGVNKKKIILNLIL